MMRLSTRCPGLTLISQARLRLLSPGRLSISAEDVPSHWKVMLHPTQMTSV